MSAVINRPVSTTRSSCCRRSASYCRMITLRRPAAGVPAPPAGGRPGGRAGGLTAPNRPRPPPPPPQRAPPAGAVRPAVRDPPAAPHREGGRGVTQDLEARCARPRRPPPVEPHAGEEDDIRDEHRRQGPRDPIARGAERGERRADRERAAGGQDHAVATPGRSVVVSR